MGLDSVILASGLSVVVKSIQIQIQLILALKHKMVKGALPALVQVKQVDSLYLLPWQSQDALEREVERLHQNSSRHS